MPARHLSAIISVGLVWTSSLAAAESPSAAVTVSPGETDRAVEIASGCPVFNWAAIAGAAGYELVVFAVAADTADTANGEPRLVLRRTVRGAALGWTPSRDSCLAPGGEYAWSVRALGEAGEPLESALDWSPPRRFTVPALPSDADVAAALDVLRRWQEGPPAAGGVAPVAERAGSSRSSGSGASAAAGTAGAPLRAESANAPTVSGSAAIRGENASVAGSEFGVLGQTASSAGAGLAAINLTDGPDLVLDGVANGEVDTRFFQSGLDRSSASDQTFDLQNSGTGRLTLLVDGVPVGAAEATTEVFQTVATYNGSGPAGYGRAGMHAGCRQEDPSSHFCTIQEIESGWKTRGWNTNATSQAWVDNAIVGTIDSNYAGDTSVASDWYGGTAAGVFPYNCAGWTNSANTGRGLILNDGSISPAAEACDDIHPIACCRPTRLRVFQTVATYNGSGPAGYGRAGMHAGCRLEDPSSHFCTIQEIENAWKEGGLSFEATSQAWVDNGIVGTVNTGYGGDTAAASDWYGGNAAGDFPYNCNGWINSTGAGRGLIVNDGAISPAVETCDDIHPIACCK